MAYNNYFPVSYNPMLPQYYGINQPGQSMAQNMSPMSQMPAMSQGMPQNQPQAQTSGIIWVQGESGAKAYPVAPGTNVLLLDSEGDRFYIKGADMSGMPQPLRIFEFRETTRTFEDGNSYNGHSDYVTREDFDELTRKLDRLTRKMEADDE